MTPGSALLTICGLEELDGHADRGVTHALSIVDPGTAEPLAFLAYGAHRRKTLRFHDIIEPEPDRVLPGPADVEAILAFGRDAQAEAPGHLLVHCHMGISRSTAAMTMLLAQAEPDVAEAVIAERVRTLRPIAWPNLRMIELADAVLRRQGRLVAAMAALYAGNLARKPELAGIMRGYNRTREVVLGRSGAATSEPCTSLSGHDGKGSGRATTPSALAATS